MVACHSYILQMVTLLALIAKLKLPDKPRHLMHTIRRLHRLLNIHKIHCSESVKHRLGFKLFEPPYQLTSTYIENFLGWAATRGAWPVPTPTERTLATTSIDHYWSTKTAIATISRVILVKFIHYLKNNITIDYNNVAYSITNQQWLNTYAINMKITIKKLANRQQIDNKEQT